MSNVWDAMKKHEVERAELARQAQEAKQQTGAPGGPDAAPGPAPAAKAGTQPIAAGASLNGTYSEVLVVHHDRGAAITEEYRSLRTNLLAQNPDQRFCYLVTSAEGGEGKTVTCLNLALVMTERVDRRTIVVDCDLRKGKMAILLNAPKQPGVAGILRGEQTLDECIQATPYRNLFFLPAGTGRASEIGELAERPEMAETVAELRNRYDYVIFDTPPINVAADAGIIGRTVGEALLVVRMNKTRRESTEKAIRLLHAGNVKLSGVVLTHRRYHIPTYLYRYS